jgi:hypothetical protein
MDAIVREAVFGVIGHDGHSGAPHSGEPGI